MVGVSIIAVEYAHVNRKIRNICGVRIQIVNSILKPSHAQDTYQYKKNDKYEK